MRVDGHFNLLLADIWFMWNLQKILSGFNFSLFYQMIRLSSICSLSNDLYLYPSKFHFVIDLIIIIYSEDRFGFSELLSNRIYTNFYSKSNFNLIACISCSLAAFPHALLSQYHLLLEYFLSSISSCSLIFQLTS